jgi:hypothetical protein
MPDVKAATPLFVTVAENDMSHCAPFDWAEMRTILDTDTAIAGLADNSAADAVPPNNSERSNLLCTDGCMAISLEKLNSRELYAAALESTVCHARAAISVAVVCYQSFNCPVLTAS